MKKVIVIGAGVSGLSAARLLKENGFEVTVFESSSNPGGLIKCDVVDGALFHRVGGHVFNTKNKIVFDWFWKHFDRDIEFLKAKRYAAIWFQDKYIGYPIENFLYMLDKSIVEEIVREILELQKQGYKDPFSYNSFEAFLKGNFGLTLYDLYFKPYNHKIWKTDLSKVSLEWLEGKLPMPNYSEMLVNNIVREEESNMVHSSFYYPKNGGSQVIADRLSNGLDIKYNHSVTNIKIEKNKLMVDGIKSDFVVFTGDIRKLGDAVQISDVRTKSLLEQTRSFTSNGTSNLLCETDDMPYSWLYLPCENTSAHRIIYTGNFSQLNNKPGARKSCTVEFSGKQTRQDMESQLPLLPGNLKSIDINYEPNSYVIQDQTTRGTVKLIKESLEQTNIYITGRFAEWEYYNMDKAIEASMNTVEKIASNV